MRDRHRSRGIAFVFAAALALLAACAGAPQSAADGAPEPSPNGAPGSDVVWEVPSPDEWPEEIAQWVAERPAEIGIFQQIAGDRTYILVSWGEKPTGGYEVRVDDVTAVDDGVLHLAITLTAPDEDAVVTQAITHPFALVAVQPAQFYEIDAAFDGARFLENGSFRIDAPTLFSVVEDQVRVAGEARVFEGVFQITVEDGHYVLAEETLQVAGAPEWAPFDVTLEWAERPSSPHGIVFIYAHSAKDGSITDPIAVPIRFADWE